MTNTEATATAGETRWITAHNMPATVHPATVKITELTDTWGDTRRYVDVKSTDGSNHGTTYDRSFATREEAEADAAAYEAHCEASKAREAARWAAMTNAEQCASMGYGRGRYCGD